jgi:hypothetical protein
MVEPTSDSQTESVRRTQQTYRAHTHTRTETAHHTPTKQNTHTHTHTHTHIYIYIMTHVSTHRKTHTHMHTYTQTMHPQKYMSRRTTCVHPHLIAHQNRTEHGLQQERVCWDSTLGWYPYTDKSCWLGSLRTDGTRLRDLSALRDAVQEMTHALLLQYESDTRPDPDRSPLR